MRDILHIIVEGIVFVLGLAGLLTLITSVYLMLHVV